MSAFAGELVALRRRCQLSQAELALRAGLSRSYLADLEAGHRGARPSLRVLEQIAKALEVDPGEFRAYRTAVVIAHPEWIDQAYAANVKAAG